MISLESINYSLRNLNQRKARSFLTILSIFVGITTIFIFISFGWGLYDYIEEMTQTGSADKIIVQPKGVGLGGLDDSFQLTKEDLEEVQKTNGVLDAQGIYIKTAEIKQDDTRKYAFLMGYNPKKTMIMDVFNIDLDKGRELRKGDSGKAVLGYNYQIKDKILPKPLTINSNLEVQGEEVRIVGFYESIGNPQDDANIYISEKYLEEIYPNSSYSWIIAKTEIDNQEKIIEDIEKNLRHSRDLEKGKEDFFVQSYQDMIESYTSALDIVIGFIILIALISVLVSAINTSNTMITSVLERVKEIGVIKSVGARNSEVTKIFLFESAFLGLMGGVIGVILGWILSYTGGIILNNLGWGFLAPHFSPWIFIGAITFAIITGAISGVVPAIKASRINPVDALRYE